MINPDSKTVADEDLLINPKEQIRVKGAPHRKFELIRPARFTSSEANAFINAIRNQKDKSAMTTLLITRGNEPTEDKEVVYLGDQRIWLLNKELKLKGVGGKKYRLVCFRYPQIDHGPDSTKGPLKAQLWEIKPKTTP
jgi:hypothetical protein